jgi:hypothetical protein
MRFLVTYYCGNEDRVCVVDADGPFSLNVALTDYLNQLSSEEQPTNWGGEVQINSAVELPTGSYGEPLAPIVWQQEHDEPYPLFTITDDSFVENSAIPYYDLRS